MYKVVPIFSSLFCRRSMHVNFKFKLEALLKNSMESALVLDQKHPVTSSNQQRSVSLAVASARRKQGAPRPLRCSFWSRLDRSSQIHPFWLENVQAKVAKVGKRH